MRRRIFFPLAASLLAVFWLSYSFIRADSAVLEDKVIEGNDFPVQEEVMEWVIPKLVATSEPRVVNREVKNGDSFYQILKSLHVERDNLNKLNAGIARKFNLNNFREGDRYKIYYSRENKPVKLEYGIDDLLMLQLDLLLAKVSIIEKPIKITTQHITGTIEGSLIASLQRKGVPDDLADKIVSVFAWEIDFSALTREDKFDVFYEEKRTDDKAIGSGKLLAVKFIHKKRPFYAFYFERDEPEHYDEHGQNLNHGPVRFDIISSLYSKRRFHPVRRSYRAHLGMDFVAETGTPVMAIKPGEVIAAKYNRANGNYVKIKHNSRLTTQYLHLSKIDSTIKKGVMVEAQQKIGEIGSTGLSSGPHLCFRVWYDGKQRNPLDYEFPALNSIHPDDMNAFRSTIGLYFSDFEM